MKGLLVAAGKGTRFEPLTTVCNKQLLPVYNKPLIYYPLATLISGGIKDILIIVPPRDRDIFQRLLGDGTQWGISLTYAEQARPGGIAEAFLIGRDFIDDKPACLILGDNIFYHRDFGRFVQASKEVRQGAKVLGCYVRDPRHYGVVELDAAGKAVSLEEKPARPKSHYAVPGLYFYDHQAAELAAQLAPSARGELEITDLNRLYLTRQQLQIELLPEGTLWIDAGTPESLLQAANFVGDLQREHGCLLGSPEQAAYEQGFISPAQLRRLAAALEKTVYGQHLLAIQ